MEPLEQNAYLFAFFYCDNTNLTKNDKKRNIFPRPVQSQWSNVWKKVFFSVPKMLPTKFLQSLRELHCSIADSPKCVDPLEQN